MEGYILFILSAFANIWQYWRKRKDDVQKELRERRFQVYSDYISKLDRVNTQLYLAQTSDEITADIMELLEETGSGSANQSEIRSRFTEIMKKLMGTLSDWINEQNTLSDEINKVRLVASPAVSGILERYSGAVEGLAQTSMAMPMQMAMLGPGNFDMNQIAQYGTSMEELKQVKAELLSAMRSDIGIFNQ